MDLFHALSREPGCIRCLVAASFCALALMPDERGRLDPVGGAIGAAFGLAGATTLMFGAIGCLALARDLAAVLPPMF